MKNSGKLIRKKIQLNTSTDHKECTAGARRLRNNNADFLKEKLLSSYQADPFGAGKTRDIATEKELPEKVIEDLIKAGKIGDEMHLLFMKGNERLIKRKLTFMSQLKRLILT